MANIDTYLNEILSAIYGEEVRGSIVNALRAQNNETENTTSNTNNAVQELQEYMQQMDSDWDNYQTGLNSDWDNYQTGLNSDWDSYQTGLNSDWDSYQTGLNSDWADALNNINTSIDNAETATQNANDATEAAKSATAEAAEAAHAANDAADAANDAADAANDAADKVNKSEDAAVAAAESAKTAAEEATDAVTAAQAAATSASESAETAKTEAERAKEYAEDASQYSFADISDKEVVFEEASEQEELESGDTVATLFGKIKKWLSDLKAACESAMPKSGGTFTGPVMLDRDPTEDLEAATKQYVDSHSSHSSVFVSAVLTASEWSDDDPPAQTIEVEGLTAETNGIIGLSQGLTYEEYTEGAQAGLTVYSQSEGSMIIVAFGEEPDIDIPVDIILLG